jgi:hypothetical protein
MRNKEAALEICQAVGTVAALLCLGLALGQFTFGADLLGFLGFAVFAGVAMTAIVGIVAIERRGSSVPALALRKASRLGREVRWRRPASAGWRR